MKTLLFTLEYPPFKGGVANYYGNLGKYWPIDEKLLILDNNKGELMDKKLCCAWWPAIFALTRKIKRSQIDYVLVGQILPLGTAALIVSLFKPFRYGIFFHGMDLSFALRTPRKKLLSRLILSRADKIICANSYVRDKLLEFMPNLADKVGVFNPGIEGGAPIIDQRDAQELINKYNLEGKTILFSLGRLVKRKGFDKTIETFINLPRELKNNLIYFIAGRGPREEYLKSLVPLEEAKKIIFLGDLTDTEKWTWLNLTQIFIMPARDIAGDFEGFGIVYLEANLCGKPVIAGNSGGIKDAVIHEETGLIVEPEDTASISAAITKLALNPELRDQLGENGRRRAQRDFNWEKRVASIVEFIK